MTNQQHSITPPPKLVEKWYEAIPNSSTDWTQQLAIKAARWGYHQALLDTISHSLEQLQSK
jgi:hypothetical protein